MGKSRLRREFLNYTDGLADTFLWHLGGVWRMGMGSRSGRWGRWSASGSGSRRTPRRMRSPRGWSVVLRVDPGRSRPGVCRTTVGGAAGRVAEPGLDRPELFAGWRLFFERLAGHEPVILVFEDLQWADQGLLDFIEQLLEWSTSVPIFILTLARPELSEKREGWPAAGVGRRR